MWRFSDWLELCSCDLLGRWVLECKLYIIAASSNFFQRTGTVKLIIPISSGKSGVGKMLITANLSFPLAKLGHQVIVADLDFGGANHHK
ncbi:MAG: hypothetical protein CL913_04810 [Deltaproteobacteria bacterium]|nr:hypothetical protein [Deltaproteobacteria bacterium]